MRRRATGERVHGPYKMGNRWRAHIITGSGGERATIYKSFATRAACEAFIAGARDEAQGTTVRGAVDAFIEAKRTKGCAETTLDNYRHRLAALLRLPSNDARPIRWLVTRGGELYSASLTKEHGQATVKRAGDTHINGLNVGRMWGNWCVKQRLLKSNPFADVERVGRKTHGSTKPRLTINESRRLEAYCLEHADNQDCVLTYGYLMLGKRASELVGVTTRDLDDDGWLLRIRKAKTVASVKPIPVPERLREMLLGLAAARIDSGKAREAASDDSGKSTPSNLSRVGVHARTDSHLFTRQDGLPMSRYVARERVRAVCKAAGVPVLPPQALRRTFTDIASMQGVALTAIADMAGHESTAVTERSYASPERIEAAKMERHLKVMQGGVR